MSGALSASSQAVSHAAIKVRPTALDVLSLGGFPVQDRDSNERTRAARRLEELARRDGSSRVAALSDGRAEAAS